MEMFNKLKRETKQSARNPLNTLNLWIIEDWIPTSESWKIAYRPKNMGSIETWASQWIRYGANKLPLLSIIIEEKEDIIKMKAKHDQMSNQPIKYTNENEIHANRIIIDGRTSAPRWIVSQTHTTHTYTFGNGRIIDNGQKQPENVMIYELSINNVRQRHTKCQRTHTIRIHKWTRTIEIRLRAQTTTILIVDYTHTNRKTTVKWLVGWVIWRRRLLIARCNSSGAHENIGTNICVENSFSW